MPINEIIPQDSQTDIDFAVTVTGTMELEHEAEVEPQLPKLPQPFQDIISESVRVNSVHQDLPTLLALSTVSAAMGRSFLLDAPPKKTSPNLFTLITAPSGSGKSETYRMIMGPLYDADDEALKEWTRTQLPKLKAEKKILAAEERNQLRPGAKEPEDSSRQNELEKITKRLDEIEIKLVAPCLIVEDVTSQKLAMILQNSNETIALLSSEASDVISNIGGRYNATGRNDDTLLLKGFSLEATRVNRVGREPVALSKPCMAVCLTTTPGELVDLFDNKKFVGGGLLARFLICQSRSRPVRDDGSVRVSDTKARDRWTKCINDILSLRDQDFIVRTSPEAMEVFRGYGNEFVSIYDSEPESSSFNARRREIAQRIALVIHVGKLGRKAVGIPLDKSTAELGCQLSTYYGQAHQGLLRQSMVNKDKEDIGRIADTARDHGEDCGEGWLVSLREVKRRNNLTADRIELLAQRYPHSLRTDSLQLSKKGGPRSKVVVVGNL